MTYPSLPLAGVLGDPVAHSWSPRLHHHWLQRYGLPGAYLPLPVAAADLATVLTAMPRMGFVGANVTIPHKEAVLPLAAAVTDRARRIGAANTLTFRPDGTFEADNTDGIGFLNALLQQAPGWESAAGPALVLGAGGAARAILAALIDAGVPKIWLANRTREKAEALSAFFGPPVAVLGWEDVDDRLSAAALIVNTTALGMEGKEKLPFDFNILNESHVVNDIVYTPLETDLLAAARRKGATAVDGLGMLLHQAAPGFARWFGKEPEIDTALRAAVLAP